jgi:hypothetical protein
MPEQPHAVSVLGNLLGYQLVWFLAVYGAGAGRAWPALAAAALFALWQLAGSATPRDDLRLIGIGLGCGVLLDGLLARLQLLHYAAAAVALPPGGAPLWILALWVAFALTLNHSLRWLRGRVLRAALLGLLGGPLAYLAAARLAGAVSFVAPAWHALTVLALGWAGALALVAAVAPDAPPQTAAVTGQRQ